MPDKPRKNAWFEDYWQNGTRDPPTQPEPWAEIPNPKPNSSIPAILAVIIGAIIITLIAVSILLWGVPRP